MTATVEIIPVGSSCLSIQQPWAHLIFAGLKPVENRSRPTRFRGRIFVHASARLACRNWADVFSGPPVPWTEGLTVDHPAPAVLPALADLPTGAVVGSVELYDCLTLADLPKSLKRHPQAGGPFCWLLRDPRPLAFPVPAKGKLGIWKW